MPGFLKSAWRHSVIDYYDKARNTPYFAPWHFGDRLGVYRWPQCNYKKRFYKYHSRLSKIATGNRCRNRWTIQIMTNRNLRDPNKFGTWDLKIGFFIGNAGKSRGPSPRYLCHVIKSPDDRLRECKMATVVNSWIYALTGIKSIKYCFVLSEESDYAFSPIFLCFKSNDSKEIQKICNSKLLQNTQIYQSDKTAFDHIYHRTCA